MKCHLEECSRSAMFSGNQEKLEEFSDLLGLVESDGVSSGRILRSTLFSVKRV